MCGQEVPKKIMQPQSALLCLREKERKREREREREIGHMNVG
jgi:hypothetical protein